MWSLHRRCWRSHGRGSQWRNGRGFLLSFPGAFFFPGFFLFLCSGGLGRRWLSTGFSSWCRLPNTLQSLRDADNLFLIALEAPQILAGFPDALRANIFSALEALSYGSLTRVSLAIQSVHSSSLQNQVSGLWRSPKPGGPEDSYMPFPTYAAFICSSRGCRRGQSSVKQEPLFSSGSLIIQELTPSSPCHNSSTYLVSALSLKPTVAAHHRADPLPRLFHGAHSSNPFFSPFFFSFGL